MKEGFLTKEDGMNLMFVTSNKDEDVEGKTSAVMSPRHGQLEENSSLCNNVRSYCS